VIEDEKLKDDCIKTRVLVLIVLDGLYFNPKKLSAVVTYTGRGRERRNMT